MARKTKPATHPASTESSSGSSHSGLSLFLPPRARNFFAGGIFCLIIGFAFLSLTDAMGQNWASRISPLLILGGYALIGFGLSLKNPF